jgi:hypothetical protein
MSVARLAEILMRIGCHQTISFILKISLTWTGARVTRELIWFMLEIQVETLLF